MASGDKQKFNVTLPAVSTAVRDTLICDPGTLIFNVTTGKINVCITKAAGAGNWEAVTSA